MVGPDEPGGSERSESERGAVWDVRDECAADAGADQLRHGVVPAD